jgi:pimeloyl-ACP methyl ester carboxylesterase
MPAATIRDITVTYDDVGTGAPVLLVHGHPFDRSMWAPQLAALSRTHRVLVPDLRGYGESTVVAGVTLLDDFARDLAALLDALAIDRVTVVGLSMGGQIAMAFLQHFRQRVGALVVADTFAQLDAPPARQHRHDTADRLVRDGMESYARETLPKMIAASTITEQPDVADHVLRMMRGAHPAGAAAALRGRALRPDYMPLLPTIDVPTLIVVGSEDEFTPVADAARMHEAIPNATMIVIDGCGHLPNLENADTFNRALLDFLAAIDG